MSLNLIDLIKGQLGPEVISRTASQLGESESGITKAISGLLPAVVGGLANNANNPSVFGSVKEIISSGLVNNLLGGSTQSSSIVSSIISLIFGDKSSSLINTVSSFAGVSNSSTSSLLNLVTGSTLGTLGKHVTENNIDASGFSNLLGDQKGLISSLLPAGLGLGSLGLGSLFGSDEPEKITVTETARPTTSSASHVTRSGDTHHVGPTKNNDNGSIWKWLLPLLLLLLAGYFLFKQCENKKTETTPVTNDSTVVVTDSVNTVIDTTGAATITRESTVVTLPSGVTINAYKGGIEDQVVKFLTSEDYKAANEDSLKDRWFNFDNLNFEFGTTKLTAESQVQLNNLKSILKEFPDAKVKIGAYTDKKGDANANLKLSADRANAVKTALGTAQVVEAEGYGSKFATVSADASDKEREADRKTAIRFVK